MQSKTINIELAENETVEIHLVKKKVAPVRPKSTAPQKTDKRFYPISWFVEYTGIPKSSVYQMTSKNLVPFSKRGRKLFFEKELVDKWLEEGRVKTKAEIKAEAEYFLTKKGRRNSHG